jgi:predicted acylesterase/phospholipase RssA
MKYLVIGPGGIKGYIMLGALFALQENNMLNNIQTFMGVSVGSIISLLLCCGYTVEEIIFYSLQMDFIVQGTLLDAWNNIKKGEGLLSINPLRKILTCLVVNKMKYVPKMKDMNGKFICVANCLTKENGLTYIDGNSFPNLSCIEAVLISCSVPFLFTKYELEDHIYVDGATINPYPLDYWTVKESSDIIGIYVDNRSKECKKTSYINNIIESPLKQLYLINRRLYVDSLHIYLYSSTYDILGITLNYKDKGEMVAKGYEDAQKLIKDKKDK